MATASGLATVQSNLDLSAMKRKSKTLSCINVTDLAQNNAAFELLSYCYVSGSPFQQGNRISLNSALQ